MTITVGTITAKAPRNRGIQCHHTTFALDASYPTGGYDLDAVLDVAGVLAGHEIVFIHVGETATYFFQWDRANEKLIVRANADGAEAGSGTNLSAVTGLEATIFTV